MIAKERLASVDLLRGIVMVIMAIDHVREYVHGPAMNFRAEDLGQTTTAIFLTRWITHFCAPVFVFCAGLGAWFWLERHAGKLPALARFLWTRGLWLIVLEFTLVRLGFFFNFDYSILFLLVFWSIGASMIALAALVHLPFKVLASVSVGMIVLHNLADGVRPSSFGSAGWIWNLLHQPGPIQTPWTLLLVAYPLIPWIGVMGAGFCFGRIYQRPPDRRARILVQLGLGLTAAFVLLRLTNIYGDPNPWTAQPSSLFTVLSFLNTTKYPPSLLFLLMTLGPAIALLGILDSVRPGERNPLLVFGRVPLFYFVLHIPLIHAVQIGMTWLQYGAAPFLFLPPPTIGTAREVFPPDYGWSLGVTYAVWIGVVVALYPVCLWFSRFKAQRRAPWASYL